MDSLPPAGDSLAEAREYDSSQDAKEPVIIVEFKERVLWAETLEHENRLEILDFLPNRRLEGFTHLENSFEKNFLAQHIKTLDTILQKSKESISIAPNSGLIGDLLAPPSSSPLTTNKKSTISLIRSLRRCQTGINDHQFLKDLNQKKDLDRFLNYLVNNFNQEPARCLLIVTIDFWAEVRTLNFLDLDKRDLMRKVDSWVGKQASSYFERQDFLPFRQATKASQTSSTKNVLLEKFKEKLRRYITTVAFIVGGYFENPYCEGSTLLSENNADVDYPKRSFPSFSFDFVSDEDFGSDEQNSFQPQKKAKTE